MWWWDRKQKQRKQSRYKTQVICWFKLMREASLDNVKGQENGGRDLSSEESES